MPVPTEYALANRVDHPKTVYLREADVTGKLDPWLGQVFDPASLDAGGDPAVIGPWIAETQAQKVAARAEIRSATGQRRMTRDEIAAIVTARSATSYRSSATPTPPTRLTCTPSLD